MPAAGGSANLARPRAPRARGHRIETDRDARSARRSSAKATARATAATWRSSTKRSRPPIGARADVRKLVRAQDAADDER